MKRNITFEETIASLKNLSKPEKINFAFDKKNIFLNFLTLVVLTLAFVFLFQQNLNNQACYSIQKGKLLEFKKNKELFSYFMKKAILLGENLIKV